MLDPDPVPSCARGTPRPLAKWLERETRIAVVTRPLRQALGQREHYTDLRGERHPLALMSAAEALLVLALLERHASTLHRGELGEHLLRPDPRSADQETLDRAHRGLAAVSATEWLHQTPLYRALRQRASQ
jgi:hypothetical protein